MICNSSLMSISLRLLFIIAITLHNSQHREKDGEIFNILNKRFSFNIKLADDENIYPKKYMNSIFI
jgi:hypothetical protein